MALAHSRISVLACEVRVAFAKVFALSIRYNNSRQHLLGAQKDASELRRSLPHQSSVRPARIRPTPHARYGVGAAATQPNQRDPSAAALGPAHGPAPHPARHQAQLAMHLLKIVANDRHLLLQVVALLT